MRASRPHEAELDAVWHRALRLPARDQYELYTRLREYLDAGPGTDTAASSQADARAEALQCLEAAAKHLRLEEGQAPTVAQYKTAAKALDLPLSSEQIVRRWERWRNATRALTGGHVPRSPAQRSLARTTGGRRRSHEDYLAGVRKWLATDPGSRRDIDYDEFVDEHNDEVARGREPGAPVSKAPGPPLVKTRALYAALGVGWKDILAVAYELTDLESAQARHARSALGAVGDLRLVGTSLIAGVLGLSRSATWRRVEEPDFPRAVATVSGHRAWVLDDIEALRDGRDPKSRVEGEMQALVMDSGELTRVLKMRPDSLRTRIHKQHWHAVPLPAGKVNHVHYWERANVNAWLKENRPAKRRPRGAKNPKKSR